MYTIDDAQKISLNYFKNDKLAADSFIKKYSLRDKSGNIYEASPDEMHRRLAREFARIDQKFAKDGTTNYTEDDYYDALKSFTRIVPQGSPMQAIGNPFSNISASNCFVIDAAQFGDSIGGLLFTIGEAAEIMKRRGGVGIDVSVYRPVGTSVNNAALFSTGTASICDALSYFGRYIGQCVSGDTKILTKEYGYLDIKYIVNNKINANVWTHKGWKKILNWFNNGKKKCNEYKFENGLSIICTPEHRFAVVENGVVDKKQINNLQSVIDIVGDGTTECKYQELIIKDYPFVDGHENDYKKSKFPSVMNEDFAYFLGFYYGDGSHENINEQNSPVEYNALCLASDIRETKFNSKIEELVEELFGVITKFTQKNENENSCTLRIWRRRLVWHFEQNNLLKQKTHNIYIPDIIWKSPISVKLAFISGLVDADGSCSGKDWKYKTISDRMAHEVQLLMYECGIAATAHKYKQSSSDREYNGEPIWEINICGKVSQSIFTESCSHKVKENDYIVKADMRMTPFYSTNLELKRSAKYHNYIPYGDSQLLSRNALLRYGNQYNIIELKDLSNLSTQRVVSIENIGEIETYDIEVDDTHLYMANGLYISNSGRQGAIMLTISDRHPDVMNFAKMKSDLTKVTGANVSIRVSNDLLKAVEEDGDWELRWPIQGTPKVTQKLKAREIWDVVVEHAWKNGEPGLLMWDNYCDNLPADVYPGFKTLTTNPCAELPLSPYDSCRLISMNLLGYVNNPHTVKAEFDFKRFVEDVRLGQQMEDNLVELEIEIIDKILADLEKDEDEKKLPYSVQRELWKKIRNSAASGRRTGLGTHGLADCLIALGIPYNQSDEMVEHIYAVFRDESYNKSVDLAVERGAFPIFNWELEKNNAFIKRLPKWLRDKMKLNGRRNISLLTIAPTGTVSILSRTSSGIEPVYEYAYVRRTKITSDSTQEVHFVDKNGDKWHHYAVLHPQLESWLNANYHGGAKAIEKALIENNALEKSLSTIECIDKLIELPAAWRVTAANLDPADRLRIIGKIQQYIDHGISQTCNFPKGTPKSIVEKFYRDAAKSGLKGVTVYVDGSRDGVLVSSAPTTNKPKNISRPKDLKCEIHRSNGHIVLVGMLDGKVYEVFAGEKKDLPLPEELKEAIIRKVEARCYAVVFPVTTHTKKTRFVEWPIKESFLKDEGMTVRLLTNLAIRSGADLGELVETVFKSADLNSFSRHVARILSNYVDCGKHGNCCSNPHIVYENGCSSCKNCGASKCN